MRYLFNIVLFLWVISIPFMSPHYNSYTELLIVAGLIFAIIKKQDYSTLKDLIKTYKGIFFVFLSIILTMFASNFFGVDTSEGYKITIKLLFRYGLVFLALLYFYKTNKFSKQTLVKFILFSLFIQAVDGVYQYIYGVDFINHREILGYRLSGGVYHVNPFGFIMAIGASMMTFIIINKKYFKKRSHFFLLVPLLMLFLFNMFYSGSRSSWMFYAVFILTQLIFINHKNKKYFFGFLGALFVFTFSYILFDDDLNNQFLRLISFDSSGRYRLWKEVLNVIAQKPMLGYGPESFKLVVDVNVAFVHNSFLEVLLYTGTVGLILFIWLLYKVYMEIIIEKKFIYLSFYFSLLAISLFDYSIFATEILLSILTIFAFFVFSQRNITRKVDCVSLGGDVA